VQEEEGGEVLALKPANLQQIVSGVILQGIEADPTLNGKSGTILKYDEAKDRYTVRQAFIQFYLT